MFPADVCRPAINLYHSKLVVVVDWVVYSDADSDLLGDESPNLEQQMQLQQQPPLPPPWSVNYKDDASYTVFMEKIYRREAEAEAARLKEQHKREQLEQQRRQQQKKQQRQGGGRAVGVTAGVGGQVRVPVRERGRFEQQLQEELERQLEAQQHKQQQQQQPGDGDPGYPGDVRAGLTIEHVLR